MSELESRDPTVSIDQETETISFTPPEGAAFQAHLSTLTAHLMDPSSLVERPGCDENGCFYKQAMLPSRKFFTHKETFTVDNDYRPYTRSLFNTQILTTSRKDPRVTFVTELRVVQEVTQHEYERRREELLPVSGSKSPLQVEAEVKNIRCEGDSDFSELTESPLLTDEILQKYERDDEFASFNGPKVLTLDTTGPLLQVILENIDRLKSDITIEDMCGEPVEMTDGTVTLTGKLVAGPKEGLVSAIPPDMDVDVWFVVTARFFDPAAADPQRPPVPPPLVMV